MSGRGGEGRINTGRLSLDHFQPGGAPVNASRMALQQQMGGRHSVDLLANEMHLQQLHLAAIQAQLQLQQAVQMQNMAIQQQQQQQQQQQLCSGATASVDHLTQALAQLQMSNGLSTGESHNQLLQPLLPNPSQEQQQANLAHIYMQQLLMQQQQQQQQSFQEVLQRKLVQRQSSNVGNSNHLLSSFSSIPEEMDGLGQRLGSGDVMTANTSPIGSQAVSEGFSLRQTISMA